MSSTEERLMLLATVYGRHPYEKHGKYGFMDRGTFPQQMFATLEEAINYEAKDIRQMMVDEQIEIANMQRQINVRLTHLGILEMG